MPTITSLRPSRHLWLLLILLVSLTQRITAQPPEGGGPGPGGRNMEISAEDMADAETQWMKRKLKLKKPTLEKVKEINLHFAQERVALFKQGRRDQNRQPNTPNQPNQSNQPNRMQQLEQEKDARLKEVLTEKQFATYLKRKDEIREELQSSGNGGFPPPPDRP